ncbi:MAG: histidinol dehydrogenase, partial [Candidatus Methanoperedens sp.]
MLIKPISQLSKHEAESLLNRGAGLSDVMAAVNPILNDVKENGDAALRKYTQQFDRAAIKEIEVSHKEIHDAVFSLDKNRLLHLKKAAANIRAFHEAQLQKDWSK